MMNTNRAIKIITHINELSSELNLSPEKIGDLINLQDKKAYELIVEAGHVCQIFVNMGKELPEFGICRVCGKNHAEVCGSCLSDIAQETGDQAMDSCR